MSSTGLEVFDNTLQSTHIWLDEIMAELGWIGSMPTTPCVPCCMPCGTGCR